MIENIKQAVFAAESMLNWTPDQPGMMLYDVAQVQAHYREAAVYWQTANYPQTRAASVAWITGTSVAEAGLSWLQEINLAIESLKDHERGIDRPLTEVERHELLRDALRGWYEFDPSRMELVGMRMRFMAELTVESNAIVKAKLPDNEPTAAPKETPLPPNDSVKEAALAVLTAPQKAVVLEILENVYPTSDDDLTDHVVDGEKPRDAVRNAIKRINEKWKSKSIHARIDRSGRNPVKNTIVFF